MEFAAGALESIAGGIGGAVATGAQAAGGLLTSAAGALGTASGFAGLLSGGATIASMLATQRAGAAQAAQLNATADDTGLDIKAETAQGTQRQNNIRDALIKTLGQQRVAFAASGVDLSFGTPVIAQSEAAKEADSALAVDQATTDARVARLKERAANLRLMALDAQSGALAKSAALGLKGAADILRRG